MIERYRVLATRIRQELSAVERTVSRAKRAVALARQHPADQDFYLDSAALNLHDFYTGLERAFEQVAALIDEHVPTGHNWHRELLEQMAEERPPTRPAVLSEHSCQELDKYLRFRHVVRNIYAFEFDLERLGQLVQGLDPVFERVRRELEAFADFLQGLAKGDEDEK